MPIVNGISPVNQVITIYWWNMGKRTLDFHGTYKNFMKRKEIKVRRIKGTGDSPCKFFISFSLSSMSVKLTATGFYMDILDDSIKTFLTLLGDKATLETPYRKYHLNWM